METVIAAVLKALSTKSGQALITWLFPILWKHATKKTRDVISNVELRQHIKATLVEYEKVLIYAQLKGADGYDEEELAEIRRRKTELEERLMNETKN